MKIIEEVSEGAAVKANKVLDRKQAIKNFRTVRHAYVVDNPENTALAVLTTSAIEDPNYAVKIFSKKENALAWLLE